MKSSEKMWLIRAGERGYLVDDFIKHRIIAIGWNEVGDLSKLKTLEGIKDALLKHFPQYSKQQVNIAAGVLYRFFAGISLGNRVVCYDPINRNYILGEVISEYEFNSRIPAFPNIRKVNWYQGRIARDSLSPQTRNSLGAGITLSTLSEDAGSEIIAVKKGNSGAVQPTNEDTLPESSIKEDMIEKAHEFIKDKLAKLDWEEMQDLMAGLLRAMGYRTLVSPPGPDRGKDVEASRDGLGLEEPRIKVEVKHKQGQIGAKDLRGFIGGLRQGDKGIFLSTGGFTKEARYEAERSNIPVTLVDADMFVKLVVQYYDQFDADSKVLLPLTKIFWPS